MPLSHNKMMQINSIRLKIKKEEMQVMEPNEIVTKRSRFISYKRNSIELQGSIRTNASFLKRIWRNTINFYGIFKNLVPKYKTRKRMHKT